jgi:CheY-like chemotaxis protein
MKKILCIDDNQPLLTCYSRALGLKHYSVATAESPALALEHDLFLYDLVTLDGEMPGMGGAEMGILLRERFPDLPILFIFGDASKAPVLPKSRIMQKPVLLEELYKNVEELLK